MGYSSSRPVSLCSLAKTSREQGCIFFGAHDAEQLVAPLNKHLSALEEWQHKGFAGEMAYMKRPRSLFAEPNNIVQNVRSVFIFGVPYSSGPLPDHRGSADNTTRDHLGRVARYAWGDDYHTLIRTRLRNIFSALNELEPFGEHQTRYFTDSVPILERALVAELAAGFFGRNSLMIRRPFGSYFFIAEAVSTLEFSSTGFDAPQTRILDRTSRHGYPVQREPDFNVLVESAPGNQCGSCTRCVTECPTGAIVADGVIDSRRCISYLTIEKRGVLDDEEVRQIGDWVYGCDICQDVCPFNAETLRSTSDASEPELWTPWREFMGDRSRAYLDLNWLLRMNDADFRSAFGSSSITRAGRDQLVRNALAVAANQRAMSLISSIGNAGEHDPSPLVRNQARRSLLKLHSFSDGLDRVRIGSFLEKSSLGI